ncbi:hypothetical protein SAMN05421810_105229 [Amycolatopsis arida]|uniref:Uncharacterized protein n=1 Tax=Amycolatopsis arida TaxID=587909 RepID=A0A1I5WQP8_9PSEU|nr:hypothetical protein [Amycolatopsis arida]TDX92403.1 hypothetical protein CLV69_105248 [Amycolatopsis arida]SFQ22125.1 hypothetical protein SAMN05421810_105229 [Amycolatopsis arida]
MPPLLPLARRSLSWHRPLMLFAAAMAVVSVVSAVGLVVDDRVLVGAPIWAKPLKFALSFLLYTVTWAWMLTFQQRARRWGWWAGTVLAGAGTVEMLVIVGQVLRGKRSHFNLETPFDTAVFGLMGTTIIVLMLGHFALGALLLAGRYADRASAAAVRWGMAVSAAGLLVGGLMLGPTDEQQAARDQGRSVDVLGAHTVGAPDGGPGIPVLNWSTEAGDLRVPHFVGMHALQLLPMVAIALALLGRRRPRLRDDVVRLRLVRIAAIGYTGLVALVTWQALRGQPVVAPDTLTLGATAALVAGVVLAAVLAVRRPTRIEFTPREEVAVR